jgi:hypothetical protein
MANSSYKAEILKLTKICSLSLLTAMTSIAPAHSALIGVDYTIDLGSAGLFESVTLPSLEIGSLYGIYMWNGSEFIYKTELPANVPYYFTPGTDVFRVVGVENAEDFDENDPTNINISITYTQGPQNTYTATPVYDDTPVPLPATLPLMGLGLGIMWLRRSRKSQLQAA